MKEFEQGRILNIKVDETKYLIFLKQLKEVGSEEHDEVVIDRAYLPAFIEMLQSLLATPLIN